MNSEIELVRSPAAPNPEDVWHEQSGPDQTVNGDVGFSLPPADGGRDAWLFLLGGFFIEALVWGFPFTFGIFQEHYVYILDPNGVTGEGSTGDQIGSLSGEASSVAIIGTTATGIMYMSALVLMPIYCRWPHFRRLSACLGLILMALGLALASFATNVSHLILTQGVCYAIGGSLLYCPTVIFIDEWFVRRKGAAFGVMWAGTGVSGAVLPFIMNSSLEAFGFRSVLRAWAVVVVTILAPMMVFVKPRLPVSAPNQVRPFDFQFALSPIFWVLELCNIIQGLGYFLPSIYLPTIAQSFGSSSIGGTLTLVCLNLAAVFGGVTVGALVDRLHVTSVMLLVGVASGLSVFLIWGFSQSLPLLLLFAIFYGFSAGSFSTVWPGIIKEMRLRYSGTDAGMVFGFLGTGRGIGAIASGPLSAALVGSSSALKDAAYSYGSDYGGLIVFTGATATASSLGFFAHRLGWL